MSTAVLVLNFGEPADPTMEEVVPFLERIFFANANLEALPDEAARRKRSRELAERRAPGLIEEYLEIGHSPMNEQAQAQADALAAEFEQRGIDASVHSAFQFTPPLVGDVVSRLRGSGVDRLIAIPIYPLCGPSTNVAAVDLVERAAGESDWNVEMGAVTGWHRHPLYLDLRADAIRKATDGAGLDLGDEDTHMVFSAHGTPKKYLDEGSRYVEYVEEFCEAMASRLDLDSYILGYQNHTNRGIEWTEPGIDEAIATVESGKVLVDPVSFMHEQSETLAELDIELREEAEALGLEFHRVPVPHDDARFAQVLADLVEAHLPDRGTPLEFGPCRCRPGRGTICLNSVPGAAPGG